MVINDNIKLIRELSGKKQGDFAKLIKTNLSNLKTYENSNVRPKANVLAAICEYAGIELSDLENKKLTYKDITFRVDKVEGNEIPTPTPATTLLTGAHVTLQDHIDLLRDYNEKLFALLSSNLGKLYDGQQVMIAYQKAWVDYEAEKASAGDLQRKDEIKYKMSTLVDEQLHGDSSTYSQSGSGKRRKA